MIIQILYFVCCACLIWELWRRNSKKSYSSPPEFSGGLPIIGHTLKVIGDRKHAFNMMKWMSTETLEQASALSLTIGPRKFHVLIDPDDCAIASNACLDKDYYYGFAKPFLGNGLTIADVHTWKQHRKLINPTFRQQILNQFLVVFNHQGRKLVNQFKSQVNSGSFNHEKFIRFNSLESICMTSFGADVTDFGGLHQQYLEGVNEILDVFTERFQKFWLHSDFIYNRSQLKKREDVIIKKIAEFTSAILEKRKMEMNDKTKNIKTESFTPIMNLLLELSKNGGVYSDEDILYETNTIVGGGYDTSACTLTLALMLLGSHPEAQKKVYDEIKEVFDNSDRDVDKDDIPKMIYLEAVLKETMRLYPIAPVVARYIVKDVQLRNYTLRAGQGVAMLFWAMHRLPMWGKDVEQFRPERWLDGSVSRNTNAFGGFSLGKRGCIGKTYAMMSMKTILTHVIRSYSITSDMSHIELEIEAILRIASGQNISIEERN